MQFVQKIDFLQHQPKSKRYGYRGIESKLVAVTSEQSSASKATETTLPNNNDETGKGKRLYHNLRFFADRSKRLKSYQKDDYCAGSTC